MGKIKWLENLLEPFEEEAKVRISSPPAFKIKIDTIHYPPKTKEEEQLAKQFANYNHKRQFAKHLLQLIRSLRKIVSQNRSLKDAIITTMILMFNAYEVGWPMTYSRIEQIKRGRIIGSKIKRKKWALDIRDAIPEKYNRPADKLSYLRAHHGGKDKPLRLPVGSAYIDPEDKEGNERWVYRGLRGKKESITIETFRTEYLIKKVGK